MRPAKIQSPSFLRQYTSKAIALSGRSQSMVITLTALPWSTKWSLLTVTVAGGFCTLGGITVTGGRSIFVPLSIASYLLGLCRTALIVYLISVSEKSSATDITRNSCVARVFESIAHIECVGGRSSRLSVSTTCCTSAGKPVVSRVMLPLSQVMPVLSHVSG